MEYQQESPYSSPWTLRQRVLMVAWEYVWILLCSWTPKPANRWRIFILGLFGAKLYGRPFVHQRARIQIPWNLTMHDRACLGDRANAYTLGEIELFEHATIAQEVYLCTGTHAFDRPELNLITAKIVIGAHVFVGARAFIMPGVEIGAHSLIGACSVVTKSLPANTVAAGNPARVIRSRTASL
ncbi:hypothetical protein JIN84_16080 [Luteolibacter yonseiensis]|uniref:Colanic acid biosynthesis acetyltransferase n=1 Tax=Luteolibacter yonseiensis TaxID=1144680 RepID=A0A934R555_9BACT|nr:DapH/DapD/GlmU-related protein [Luteolibacter yonseiensis]MBK1817139.1 hypothetical protein [Luteolibacter yonseiensis]